MDANHHVGELRERGFSIRQGALAPELCDELVDVIGHMAERSTATTRCPTSTC
jgi:hypothetical protein